MKAATAADAVAAVSDLLHACLTGRERTVGAEERRADGSDVAFLSATLCEGHEWWAARAADLGAGEDIFPPFAAAPTHGPGADGASGPAARAPLPALRLALDTFAHLHDRLVARRGDAAVKDDNFEQSSGTQTAALLLCAAYLSVVEAAGRVGADEEDEPTARVLAELWAAWWAAFDTLLADLLVRLRGARWGNTWRWKCSNCVPALMRCMCPTKAQVRL